MWEHFERTVRDRAFHPFIAADYEAVRDALLLHRAPGQRFLELGSATGIIAIMADMMGYEAYGIELDDSLVRMARDLAARFDSSARFVTGSFVPTGYRWPSSRRDHASLETTGEGPSGYLQLGKALDEFDTVFGYPWGDEAPMMLDLMKVYGRPDALLMLYDVTHGVRVYRGNQPLRTP